MKTCIAVVLLLACGNCFSQVRLASGPESRDLPDEGQMRAAIENAAKLVKAEGSIWKYSTRRKSAWRGPCWRQDGAWSGTC